MAMKVVKADASQERYLHTKVIGTINNALDSAGRADAELSQHLAEVVTYFVHRQGQIISSGEVFSIIKAILEATGHTDAAEALDRHHYLRKLSRARVEVLHADAAGPAQLEALWEDSTCRLPWQKQNIVAYIMRNWKLEKPLARTIASAVEQKIFNIGSQVVCSELIKQLVLAETAAFSRAQKQFTAV